MSEETNQRLIELASTILEELRLIRADFNKYASRDEEQKVKTYNEAMDRVRLREAIQGKNKSSEELS
jgi:hypothetical protein